ncbi:MAG: hypothetical protein IJM81_09980, partial [Prevotella sp.]|nr:hypothetical protein [Prevotella sp.]
SQDQTLHCKIIICLIPSQDAQSFLTVVAGQNKKTNGSHFSTRRTRHEAPPPKGGHREHGAPPLLVLLVCFMKSCQRTLSEYAGAQKNARKRMQRYELFTNQQNFSKENFKKLIFIYGKMG